MTVLLGWRPDRRRFPQSGDGAAGQAGGALLHTASFRGATVQTEAPKSTGA